MGCRSDLGGFTPRVDAVILHQEPGPGASIELVFFDRLEQRVTLPWWLWGRSLRIELGSLSLLGAQVQVTRRMEPVRTVVSAEIQGSSLETLRLEIGALPEPMLQLLSPPGSPEGRAVLRDYALQQGLCVLAGALALQPAPLR